MIVFIEAITVHILFRQCHAWGKENLLLVLTIGGVFAGIILGIALRAAEPSKEAIRLIAFPGDILMRMLKMMILPLIVSCMITGEIDREAQFIEKVLNCSISVVRSVSISNSLTNIMLTWFVKIFAQPHFRLLSYLY